MNKINLFSSHISNFLIAAILLIVFAFSSGEAATRNEGLINNSIGENYLEANLSYSLFSYQNSFWNSIICQNNLFTPLPNCVASSLSNSNQSANLVGNFTLTASPTSRTVNQGGTATYSITIQSTGGFNSPVSLNALNLPGNQVLPGTGFSPQMVTPPTNGSTTSTLNIVTNNQTLTGTFNITIRGTGSGITKDIPITLTVNAPNFSISSSPASRTVTQGGTATYNISLSSLNGFNGTVSLTALNLPGNQVLPGTGFSPPQVTLASGGTTSSTLTIVTNNQTLTGTFTITVRGTSGSLSRETNVTLTVISLQDFSVSATPSSRSVPKAGTATYTITVQSISGFNSPVSLTALNLPGNQVLPGTGFNPQTATPPVNSSTTSTLNIVTNNQTPTGTFTITIRGTSGSVIRETTISLTVNQAGDFTISVTPTSTTVAQGNTAIYTVGLQSINGFSGTVNLTALNLPGNQVLPGTGFNPSSITLSPNGSATSTLSIVTNTQTITGNFTITIRGTSGSVIKDTTTLLNITPPPDFIVSATPSSRTVAQGEAASYTITVQSSNGFNNVVNFTALNLPGNQVLPGTGFSPQSVTPPANGSTTSTLTIITNNQTPTGNFTITIRGTNGSLIRETTVTLTVNQVGDFSISASPTSRTVSQGGTATYTITLQSINGFSGIVSLTAINLPGNQVLPGTGFTPQQVTLAPSGNASSTLSIVTNNQTPTGTFTITIRGTGGNLTRETPISLIVTPSSDFSISATPSSRTVTQGESATYTITVQSINGFNNPVSLTALNLPGNQVLPGTEFNPQTVTPSSNSSTTSTLTIITNNQTLTGSFTITVRGTSGGLIKDTPITLDINQVSSNFTISASPTSLTVSRGSNAIYGVTVSSLNGFSGTVSLAAINLPGNQVLPGTGFVPAQVTVAPGSNGTSTLTIVTNNTTPTGNFPIIVRGNGNNITREANINLTVNGSNTVPSINNITSPVSVNQTTNLTVNGENFQNNFSAAVTTTSGTFPIAAAGLTFVNSNQIRVQVTMGGTPPYTATLRITNPDNQSASGQFQVVSTTNPPPSITSISPSQVQINQATTLTVNGNNFQPNFRVRVQGNEIAQVGLTFINSGEVRVQVTMGGIPPYQASLLLTNSDNQSANGSFNVSNTTSNTNSPTAIFSFAPSNPNINQAIQFTSTSTGQSLTHAWDFQGDGVFDSNDANPTFTYSTPGPRSVILRVTNSYGSSTVTNVVNVGTTNTSAPSVTNVFRTYPGLYFLKNANYNNNFDVRVNWNGSPGRVKFQVNNDAPIEVPGTASGAIHAFNLSTAFPANGRSIVKITPINGQGAVGAVVEAPIYVFPYPTWLDDAIIRVGPQALNFTAESGQIKANFNVDFPQPKFKAEVPIPSSVPYIGGTLGIRESSAFFRGFASSNGTGNLTLGGRTGFKAMGQEIGGNISGGGNFTLNQSGLSLQSATFNLGLDGTISRGIGVIDAIPYLSALNYIPAIKQFNQNVQLVGQIKPKVQFSANWLQDQQTRHLRFNNATGRVELEMLGELKVNITDHIKAKGWVSGAGGITFRVPQEPFVQRLDLNFQAGMQVNVDYLLAGFQWRKTKGWGCTWTPSNSQAVCASQISPADYLTDKMSESDQKVDLIQNDYNKFGGYETFHSNAEKTSRIARKDNSEMPLSITESSLINNLFPGAEPILLEVGTGRMLLWVRQNPNLPVLQSTEIAWSYYDGTSWSNPAVFASDTRAELSPVAGVDANGKVVAAWLRVKDPAFSINIENVADLPLFYKQMEVVSAVFNPTTRTWGAETALTDDLALDTNLRLSASNNGNLLLTWQSNPNGEFNADAANPATLKYSFWNGSSWNTVGVVTGNLVNVSAQATAIRGNNAFIILPRDPDLNVSGDRILDIYTWDGSNWSQGSTFARGNLDNILPSAGYDSNGQGQVVWLRGADLVQATLSNPIPRIVRQGSDSMAFYNARLFNNSQGNLTLVWQEMADNGPANIFATLYDINSQTWSADLRLNENDWSAKDVSGYYGSDGRLRMAYLATQVLRRTENITIEGQNYEVPNVPEDGQTDLRLLEHSLITDLAVTDADLQLAPQIPQAGESVTATVNIRNAGDFTVGSFNVKLYAGNPSSGGVLLNTTRVNAPFAAGETRTITLSFAYPQTPLNIVAVIDADNEIDEFSESNNRATVYFENTPPVAIATASVTSGNLPLTVNFNASSSYDGDGDALSFAWSFADGSSSAIGASVSHIFEQSGLYPVTVSVSDARGAVSTATVNISVNCNALTITPSILPDSSTGIAYSQNISAAGGTAPYSFVVTSGALPAGLTLATDGLLSGTPTEIGIFNFTITVTYANGCPGTREFTMTINQSRLKDFDFDGDGKADVSVFRPSNGVWYLNQSTSGFRGVAFGFGTDKIVPADYDGDGKTDIAVYRGGIWYIQRSQLGFTGVAFGDANDIPVPADYDGDGKADIAVFRPSTGVWYLLRSSLGFTGVTFGQFGDRPVAADYDGDGKADVAVYRGGTWYIQRSQLGFTGIAFGDGADKPIPADYDGDGKADVAVFRPSNGTWYLQRSSFGFTGVQFGEATDLPTPADYDGDGKADVAVFRPSSGAWYLQRSQAGFTGIAFGASGDKPAPNAFVP